MPKQLPLFEGRQPARSQVEVLRYEEGVTDAFDLDEEVAFVGIGAVIKVTHDGTAEGVERVHKVKPAAVYVVPADRINDLLEELRVEKRQAEEDAAGVVPLNLDREEGDESSTEGADDPDLAEGE